jgi:hypothetical protein
MRLLLIVVLAIYIQSCAPRKITPVKGPSAFESMIADTLKETNSYARGLSIESSHVRKLNGPTSNIVDYDILPESLRINYDVRYYGDVVKLMYALSKQIGFNFVVSNVKPSIPIDVYVNDKDTKLIDILKHIGSQLSSQNKLTVNAHLDNSSFTVEIEFGKGN